MKKVKITVLKTTLDEELAAEYGAEGLGPCPMLREGQGAGRAHRTLLRQGVSQKCQIHGIEEGGALPRTWRCITARWPRTTTRS